MKRHDLDIERRHVLRTAMGGVVGFLASGLPPSEVGVPHAHAAVVTPNPIGARIQKSGVAVEIAAQRGDEDILHTLPAHDTWRFTGDATKRPFVYPVAQYDRSEAFDTQGRPFGSDRLGIAGGFVYRGSAIPALTGHYVCGDLVNGRIFHVPVSQLKLGSVAQLKELTLKRNGQVVTLRQAVGYSERVDLRFGEGEDGALYVLTKQDGKIRKLRAA